MMLVMKKRPEPVRYGVIYARYSSHNQKEESIEQQIEECMAFALQNGIKIVQVYADKALSGRTDKRPQFQKLMRDAEKGEFTVVIAYKSNRISRNMLQALNYEDRLGRIGIETLYAKEEFGNSAAGRFALRTMMNVNQFYSENMAEDIKRGMRDNAENCKVNGALPLGYVKATDGRYAIEPKEAELVRSIYDRVLLGETFADIANSLNAKGIKTKRGSRWNKNSFHRLLTNDVYIGVYRHSGFVKEGGVPPIIEREVFYNMQKYLESKKSPRGRNRQYNDYLLTGKLRCGYCGSFMVGVSGTSQTGAKHFYYTCNGHRNGGDCKKENVRKDFIEYAVAELTKKIVLKDEIIEWIAVEAVKVAKESSDDGEIAQMEAELAEDRKATKNIMTAIEQGIFTATTKDRLLELEANISSLEQSILTAKSIRDGKLLDKNEIIYALTRFREGDTRNKDYQKRLINTFVRTVYLWDNDIGIDYYYGGKENSVRISLKEFSKDGSSDAQEVLTKSLEGHHKRVIRTKTGREVIIFLLPSGFVLLSPLSVCGQ